MEKIFDRLGIYDLTAVLLSGVTISAITWFLFTIIHEKGFGMKVHSEGVWFFLIMSYFIGILFQEVGSLLQREVFDRKDRLLIEVLEKPYEQHKDISAIEKKGVFAYVKKQMSEEEVDEKQAFTYCRYYIMHHANTARIDHEQSLSAMSRSMGLYFGLLSVACLLAFVRTASCVHLMGVLVSVLLAWLLFYRAVRFIKIRYARIFKSFYYQAVAGKED